jgi:hypothetical protein
VDPENFPAVRPSTRMVKRRIQNGDKEESYERIQSECGIGGIKGGSDDERRANKITRPLRH